MRDQLQHTDHVVTFTHHVDCTSGKLFAHWLDLHPEIVSFDQIREQLQRHDDVVAFLPLPSALYARKTIGS